MIAMLKKYFVKQGLREVAIQDFIKDNFPSSDYSHIELQRTPLGIKILIYTHKPGRVIGRSGAKINKLSEILKTKFELDNPQLDVKSVDNPDLDARIVAKQIRTALERGYNYKKIGNLAMKRVMDAGAVGVEIIIAGKLGGSKGRTGKFISGVLKHCGDPAQKLVDSAFEEVNTKPGMIGIKVKVMKEYMDITGELRKKGGTERAARKEREEEPMKDAIANEEGSLDFDYAAEAAPAAAAPADAVPVADAAAAAPDSQAVADEPEAAPKKEKNKRAKA